MPVNCARIESHSWLRFYWSSYFLLLSLFMSCFVLFYFIFFSFWVFLLSFFVCSFTSSVSLSTYKQIAANILFTNSRRLKINIPLYNCCSVIRRLTTIVLYLLLYTRYLSSVRSSNLHKSSTLTRYASRAYYLSSSLSSWRFPSSCNKLEKNWNAFAS